jgi:hypothetical protein
VFRIGIIVLLAMLALLTAAAGAAPRKVPAERAVAAGPVAVWMCHTDGRCLHMMTRHP